jgi:hypothetical protein
MGGVMKLRFPERSDTHVAEAESWRLLQGLAPKEWIVREVSERDYGIDAYIELVSKDGQITGHLLSAQLKGVRKIDWKSPHDGLRAARSPSVKTTTAAYWLGLPVPVFLLVADQSSRDIYFVAVKEGIRAQFDKLNSQDNVSFKLADKLSLKSKGGVGLLRWLYERERLHEQFSFHITNLINQADVFVDFIQANQNRDSFMEVEAERHLQFRALYESCRMTSLYLMNEWTVEPLNHLYRKDRREWKDDYTYLHEKTLDYALQKIEKLFPALVRKAIALVCDGQAAYWLANDPTLFGLCASGEFSWKLKRLEDKASRG